MKNANLNNLGYIMLNTVLILIDIFAIQHKNHQAQNKLKKLNKKKLKKKSNCCLASCSHFCITRPKTQSQSTAINENLHLIKKR